MRCEHCNIEIEPAGKFGYYHIGKTQWHNRPSKYTYCYVATAFGNPRRTFDTNLVAEPCTKEQNIKKILEYYESR